MSILFREHRGGLNESLATRVELKKVKTSKNIFGEDLGALSVDERCMYDAFCYFSRTGMNMFRYELRTLTKKEKEMYRYFATESTPSRCERAERMKAPYSRPCFRRLNELTSTEKTKREVTRRRNYYLEVVKPEKNKLAKIKREIKDRKSPSSLQATKSRDRVADRMQRASKRRRTNPLMGPYRPMGVNRYGDDLHTLTPEERKMYGHFYELARHPKSTGIRLNKFGEDISSLSEEEKKSYKVLMSLIHANKNNLNYYYPRIEQINLSEEEKLMHANFIKLAQRDVKLALDAKKRALIRSYEVLTRDKVRRLRSKKATQVASAMKALIIERNQNAYPNPI